MMLPLDPRLQYANPQYVHLTLQFPLNSSEESLHICKVAQAALSWSEVW